MLFARGKAAPLRSNHELIAFCGRDCSHCDIFRATVSNDRELRIRTAEEWSEMLNIKVKPKQIRCRGCRSTGNTFFYCENYCMIRKIGMKWG